MSNRLWDSDFTYVSSWQGTVYVAFVIDVFPSLAAGQTNRPFSSRFRNMQGRHISPKVTVPLLAFWNEMLIIQIRRWTECVDEPMRAQPRQGVVRRMGARTSSGIFRTRQR